MSWTTIIIFCTALILATVIFFAIANARKSKFGINFAERVHCPSCNKAMPIIREPENTYQSRYGGWTCSDCGTMMDKWGQAVDESGKVLK